MYQLYEKLALGYFVAATITLMLFSIVLFASAVWTVVAAVAAYDPVDEVLDSIGLLIIGFAVVETSKFIAEEEVLRKRELRSALESRRSLTKFITIIVIAASLEALVMVFKTSRQSIPDVVYPAALFVAAMLALTALGAYQYMSSRIEPGGGGNYKDEEPERREAKKRRSR